MGFGSQSFLICKNGLVKGTGFNTSGQLGLGDFTNRNTFQDILPSGVVQVARGEQFTMFLMQDGTVKGCGSNAYGQLGNGSVDATVSTLQTAAITNVKQIACGFNYTMFLMKDGTVKSVGQNNAGQLGLGSTTNFSVIQTTPLTGVKQIACGGSHTMFLMQDGSVKVCGSNAYGQLAQPVGTITTVKDNGLTNVRRISCGFYFTMFLMKDGTVKAVGRNDSGQLGLGNITDQTTPQALALTGVKQVSCGQYFAMFLMQDGTVKACGANSLGQLGIGTNTSYEMTIKTLALTAVKEIATASFHAVFLMQDGTVKGVGYNVRGELGLGNTSNQNIAQTINVLTVEYLMDYIQIGINRFLFKFLEQVRAWTPSGWKDLNVPVTKELFLSDGVTALDAVPLNYNDKDAKILKWSDESVPMSIGLTVPKSLYDATNKLYKGISTVETAVENLTIKPKLLIVNAEQTEAIIRFSLDNGVKWYTIVNRELTKINQVPGNQLKIQVELPNSTSTLTALSYAWA